MQYNNINSDEGRNNQNEFHLLPNTSSIKNKGVNNNPNEYTRNFDGNKHHNREEFTHFRSQAVPNFHYRNSEVNCIANERFVQNNAYTSAKKNYNISFAEGNQHKNSFDFKPEQSSNYMNKRNIYSQKSNLNENSLNNFDNTNGSNLPLSNDLKPECDTITNKTSNFFTLKNSNQSYKSNNNFNGSKKSYQHSITHDKAKYNKRNESMLNKNAFDIEKRNTKIDISNYDQREILVHELNLNKYECMICMNIIRKESSIWSCDKCYHLFHLHCINKWAVSSDKMEKHTNEDTDWSCPACKNSNQNVKTNKLFYLCFCSKQIEPVFKQGTTPHSCGEVCSRKNQANNKCPHLCSLQCHPGPCPPCEASITRQCHCGRTRITARCIADETQFQCQSICERTMQCGVHKCEKECHVDNDGHQCQVKIEQKCWCGSSNRSVFCGSNESMVEKYECGEVCNHIKNCGNHKCELLCHEGDCEECEQMPNKVHNCCCGKKKFEHLHLDRETCLDPIPSCGDVCGKKYPNCEHSCANICHVGECEVCPGTSLKKCRCQSTAQKIDCASNEVVQCKQRCKEKLLCGRHRCDKQCCDLEVHVCVVDCGRPLSCKKHRCDRECGHPGSCPSCPNVSFEELFCNCGVSFSLPPIACGQEPPFCNRPCSRDHQCEHPVRHNCHTESICPPCTDLVSKPCPGGHKEYANVPCFRTVTTCGSPCGLPLPRCSHTCIKPCHSGACVDSDDEGCRQPCTVPRSECNHPCNGPCHPGQECDQVMTKCTKELTLTCECTLRSSLILCDKLRSITIMLRSDKFGTSGGVDVTMSDKDGKPYLTCDGDCKKAARNSRMAEAISGVPVKLSLLHTYYPDSLKDFGARYKNYVVSVQNVLVRLHNAILNSNNPIVTDSISVVSVDQAQFVQRYADCFKMKWHCVPDQRPRATAGAIIVVIEAYRGSARVPRPLLTEVLKEKYPHLFIEEPKKDTQLSSAPSTVSLASLSFADRLKLNTK